MRGKVKFFNKDKGFGFIIPDDPEDKKDIFVHSSNINDAQILLDGQHVEFDLDFGARGRVAKNVTIIPAILPDKESEDDTD